MPRPTQIDMNLSNKNRISRCIHPPTSGGSPHQWGAGGGLLLKPETYYDYTQSQRDKLLQIHPFKKFLCKSRICGQFNIIHPPNKLGSFLALLARKQHLLGTHTGGITHLPEAFQRN